MGGFPSFSYVCVYIYMCVWVCMWVWLVAQLYLFVTPWNVAHQAPLCTEFPKQEYWSGLPCTSPEHLPYPEIKLVSPALVDSLQSEPQGKPIHTHTHTHTHGHTHTHTYIQGSMRISISFKYPVFTFIFFAYIPRIGIAGSYVISVCNFFEELPCCLP